MERAIVVSFHFRSCGKGGGHIASRGFREVVGRVWDEVVDAYQDDPPGVRNAGCVRVSLATRSKLALLVRLATTGGLGRLRFAFSRSNEQPDGKTHDLIVDGVGFSDVLPQASPLFARSIVLHHNFEPDYYSDAYFGHPMKPLYIRAGYRALRTAFGNASINLFLTAQDRERSLAAIGRPIGSTEVFGFFEPPLKLEGSRGSRVGPLRVLVTGNLSKRKGFLGLCEMLRVARVEAQTMRTSLRFVVTGRDPTAEIWSMADGEFVEVVGNPSCIGDIACRCDVYCNPNYTGSGMKIRNLDGLRHGLPVLCRVENAAGFEELHEPVFRTFRTSKEGLQMLAALNVEEVRSEQMTLAVWGAYADRFGLSRGVERLREILGRGTNPRDSK